LNDLVSSKKMVFDLHDSRGRISTAVLVDRVRNNANDACLEIVSMRSGVDTFKVLSKLLSLATDRTPSRRSGFQVELPVNTARLSTLVKMHGLVFNFDTFIMQRSLTRRPLLRRYTGLQSATKEDLKEVYELLRDSFAENPEASIPSWTHWRAGVADSVGSHVYVWREAKRIIGFANLVEDRAAKKTEIRTLGVAPERRGRGVGRRLLQRCLDRTWARGFRSCQLSVTVANSKASDLYRRNGFKVLKRLRCFRRAR
jgi:ribosomal protein S18 acetylase RimI-like enzyme